jgi:hypothetical protein
MRDDEHVEMKSRRSGKPGTSILPPRSSSNCVLFPTDDVARLLRPRSCLADGDIGDTVSPGTARLSEAVKTIPPH